MEKTTFGGGGGSYPYENGVVMMTRDPKPRLRWTADLHDRFVDAVTKLGGPDKIQTWAAGSKTEQYRTKQREQRSFICKLQ
ncbi:myb family transcription factor APL-like isoform X1 [Populus alba x Populus x berolinensis]|nr:myb family transcription factor APL-like isoform X1 [Populus alba x Populus x berolinensis]